MMKGGVGHFWRGRERDLWGRSIGVRIPSCRLVQQNPMRTHSSLRSLSLVLITLLASCTSTKVRLEHGEPVGPNEEALGYAEGVAGGFMLFQVFPIGQNDRFERAYQKALASIGADRLFNVTVWESWYWAGVGNGYVFHVAGSGVRKKKQTP